MIPKTDIYKSSIIKPAHSRADIEELLEKFGVKKFMWQRDTAEDSALIFAKTFGDLTDPIVYKVTIPYIEKETGNRYNKVKSYDEIRSYRILFHVLKHMLLNTDVGMTFEQVFSAYTVVDKVGVKLINVMDRMAQKLLSGQNPQTSLQLGITVESNNV